VAGVFWCTAASVALGTRVAWYLRPHKTHK
jgi:hypothetical protein